MLAFSHIDSKGFESSMTQYDNTNRGTLGRNKRKEHQVEWAAEWRGEYLWGDDPLTLLEEAEKIVNKCVPF